MIRLVAFLWLLTATISFGANPSYTVFRGTGGIFVTTNPPTGLIIIDGSGVFTSSGTNATIATSTNGMVVAVASTNINFVGGTNIVIRATNTASTTHIGIHAVTDPQDIGEALNVFLLTDILPVLVVDTATITNLGASPPISSVQYNSNNVTRGNARFVFTNGPGPQVGIGTGIPAAGSTLDVTGHIYAADVIVTNIAVAGQGMEVTTGSFVLNGGDATATVTWNGLGSIRWTADGVMRFADSFASGGFNRFNLGGTDAGSPAIGKTNGDVIILGANGAFKLGGSTNRLIAPAVHIANDGGVGTPLLSLDNPLSAIRWDLAIDSNPQTYFLGLGRVGDGTPTMVWELGGNVGINTTNPATTLDVNGRFRASSNVYFPNISSNIAPVAMLVTDSGGEVYEAALPTVTASPETNAVLTNLIGTVARNVTNVVSLSTTNASSKPLTNAFANGVLTLFGLEATNNLTATPNGSNIVISGGALLNNFFAMGVSNIVAADANLVIRTNAGLLTISNAAAGAITFTGHSNAIPYVVGAGTSLTYYDPGNSLTNPGFGFNPRTSGGPQGGYDGLMVFANESLGLVTIGHPNPGADFATFATALTISNRYNGAGDFKNDMVKIDAVLVNASTLQADSTMTRWRVWQAPSGGGASTSSRDVAELTIDGRMKLYGGTLYYSNTVAFPTAAELGVGGYWVGVSNGPPATLVSKYSLDGTTVQTKVLVP